VTEHAPRFNARRLWAFLLACAVGAMCVLGWSPASGAQDAPVDAQQEQEQEQETVGVGVFETTPKGRTAIEDAKVELSKDGKVIETLTTGTNGRAESTLPGPGVYELKLLEESLPKGKKIPDSTANPQKFDTSGGATKNVKNFQIGSGQANRTGFTLSKLANQTMKGIRYGLLIGLCSIGLSLIFGTTGLTNFAHGELVTLGAAVTLILNNTFKVPLPLAATLAVGVGALCGALNELVVWRTLRQGYASRAAKIILTAAVGGLGLFVLVRVALSDGAIVDKLVMLVLLAAVFGGSVAAVWRFRKNVSTSLVGQLVVSIGLSIFYRYSLYYMVGGRTSFYREFRNQTEVKFGPFSLTPTDIFTMILAVVVLACVGLMLERTRMGKAIRAVADNRALASSSGIDVQRVILSVWILGGALAALGGFCLALGNAGVRFDTGSVLLLLMFAGVTLGGLGTAYGALLGSLLIGILVEVSPLFIAADLKDVTALVVLVLILLLRPQGLLGKKQRIG
jgi:branched-chain amino acid transport system permease protein